MGYPATGPQLKGLTRSVPTGLLGRGELDNFFVRYAVKDDRTRRNRIILRLLLYQALTLEELETLRPPPQLRAGKITIPETTTSALRTLELRPFQILDLQEYILITCLEDRKDRTSVYR